MPSSVGRRVKIVCTLGPATSSREQIAGLIAEGMDVARLNFSHGTHEFHRQLVTHVREAAQAAGRQVAIMQDLQGPKLRVGALEGGAIELKAGQKILLFPEGETPRAVAGLLLIPISAEIALSIAKDLKPGARILFDDGRILIRAVAVSGAEIEAEVVVGGRLTDHKGMNLPGTPLSLPSLCKKDLEDLAFGIELGVDAVALSFVRSVGDILSLKARIGALTSKPPLVIAKIEREEAIEAQESIINVIDGLLIARGDMAVEIGAERVPSVQKSLIRACNKKGVPVITATQMLESMMQSPTPTRAEASDVANAVFDGTDAVMLSGETAAGLYPRDAIQTMRRIIGDAELWMKSYACNRGAEPEHGSVLDSIEASAAEVARYVGASAVACISNTGTAVRTLARFRPEVPIVAVLDNESILRRLAFVWGVRGAILPKLVGTDDIFQAVERILVEKGWASHGDLVVITAGIPTLRRGTTNMLKVHQVAAASR